MKRHRVILDMIYRESHRQLVWFSWRPAASDPGDDLVLDAVLAGKKGLGF